MSTSSVNQRNGTHRSSLRAHSSASTSAAAHKPSLKSKTVLRKSSPAALGSGSSAAAGSKSGNGGDAGVPGRVRVAVRLRPKNGEEMIADADFADCVELQPEVKRLKLRKNNWDTDTFEFDEVLTEYASQKRVYEVVAKPVVEGVLDGYNGTIMAYGQTGTGKTYTLGQLGEEDVADRGIMVRAMEDILAQVSLETDSISVSYLQLYMETVQDLLDPANDNIAIVEDPKSGDVSLPGATLVEIRDQHSFLELLQLGEAHRFAANTKLNTESSRSHAILMVHVRRSLKTESNGNSHMTKSLKPPVVRKGKLVVVDLAGSERISKSGSEGHTLEEAKSINLSLSALGKCINALAENSSHVPFRDSKLTRLLRDSFGGTARTSLVITIGPSPRHRGETTSTIMFGQRAMKVENMVKLKEEFDYKSLSKRLEVQLDSLIEENERQQKAFVDEIERITVEAHNQISEAEKRYANALEEEKLRYQNDYVESIKKLEENWSKNQKKLAAERLALGEKNGLDITSNGNRSIAPALEEVSELKRMVQKEAQLKMAAEEEVNRLKLQLTESKKVEVSGNSEIMRLHKMLETETQQKEKLEEEIATLHTQLLQLSLTADETRQNLERHGSQKTSGGALDSFMSQLKLPQLQDPGNAEKPPVAKLFEQVGLQKILSLLEAEDADVRIHAVKVVANLAAEEANQQQIVEAGGLTSLLMLLRNTEDETIHRVAAGAIANLAMNETNQELIMDQGGIDLLSSTAANAQDPQTLRMVAGAIANLCGNGTKRGKSLLIEDGALSWIVQNAKTETTAIKRHIELALCHLAQHEGNAKEMVKEGAIWELVRISRECSREDIRSLAHRTLTSSPTFLTELRRLRVDIR
uniref:Kinesin-like protein n=1 Tax=Brassica campestris TaxID=3711 RepID=M4DTC3_BRACM